MIPAYEILDPNRKNIIHQKKFLMKIVMNLTVLTFQIGNAKYVESRSKKGTFGIISGMEEMKQNQ